MSSAICFICNSPRSDSAGPCSVCGAPPLTSARNLPAGTHLQNGKYTLGRVLGEGGFGITYLGAHRHLRHTVAIKELFPERAIRHGTTVSVPDSQQWDFHLEKERVLEEARVISRLDSPHIVGVDDAFLENNTAYIVMEYLEGQSLQERIEAEGSLPPDDVHRIAMAACDALTEVHRQGLLHRDIKPANIMLTRDGRVVLVDFGSARTFDSGRTVRHTRMLTADYAAPEMFSTRARFAPATDLFCLGGTLYHALTGNPPPSVMDRLQDPSLNLAFPEVLRSPSTEPLIAAVCQALQVRVENRPPSPADFRTALLDSAVPVVVDTVATSPTESPPRGSTRAAPPNTGTRAQTPNVDKWTDALFHLPQPLQSPRTVRPNLGRWTDTLSRGQWTWVGVAVLLILTVIVFGTAVQPTATRPTALQPQPTATPPPCRSLEVVPMSATFWDLSCTTEREQSEFWKGQVVSLLSDEEGWVTDTFVASWEVFLEDELEPAILQHWRKSIRARDCLALAVKAAEFMWFIDSQVFHTCNAYKLLIDSRFANWLEEVSPQPTGTPIPLFDIGSTEELPPQPTDTLPGCRRLADVPRHATIGLPIDTTFWDLSCATEEEQVHFWGMAIANMLPGPNERYSWPQGMIESGYWADVKERTGWPDWPLMWSIFTETWSSAVAILKPLIPQRELQSIRAYDCIHLAMQAAGFHSGQPDTWRGFAPQPTCNSYKPQIDGWFRNWLEEGLPPQSTDTPPAHSATTHLGGQPPQPTDTLPGCRRLADVPRHASIGLPIDTTFWDLNCATEEEQAFFWEMTIANMLPGPDELYSWPQGMMKSEYWIDVKVRTGWPDWILMWDIFTETWISAVAELKPLISQHELQSIRTYDCIHLAMQAAGFHSGQPDTWRWFDPQPTCNAYKPQIDGWFRNWPEAGPPPPP